MGFSPIPRTSMRAHWRLENENDSSGNSRTLTNVNTVTFGAAKFSNGALFTNGTPFNKCLTRGPHPFSSLRPTDVTMSFWFKLTDTAAHVSGFSSMVVVNTINTDTTGMSITYTYTISGGNITHSVNMGFSGGGVTLTSVLPSEDAWHHYVFVKEGLAFRLYRDAVLLDSDTGSGNEVSTATGTDFFAIGNDRAISKTHQCKGIMDEFIVEERVWTLNEIRKIYTQYKGFMAV